MAQSDKPQHIKPVKVLITKSISGDVKPVKGSDLPMVELPNIQPEDPPMANTPEKITPPVELTWWQSLSLRFFSGQIVKYLISMFKVIFSLVGLYKRDPETGKIIIGKDKKPETTPLGSFIAGAIGFFATTSYALYEVSGKTIAEWIAIIFGELF
jgi:hypothetical protein